MKYLVDTNVFAEELKPSPETRVVEWLRKNEANLYVSTITIAEIRRGFERLPQSRRRAQYEEWLTRFSKRMGPTILSFSKSVAHVWGQMIASMDLEGKTMQPFDSILAATAKHHNLVVVTRNVREFRNAPVKILNPFDESESEDISE